MEPKVVRGGRLRDEFLCPITVELMREPTVAADGHSYERDAIETWIKKNTNEGKTKSPRTGEHMGLQLLPNLNLRKLIQDLLLEGGAGLYVEDQTAKHVLQVATEQTVVLTGLGPADSEWNHKTFQIRSAGCTGGRGVFTEEIKLGQDIMQFKDVGVSRKHFKIEWLPDSRKYGIRDLGSIGGTFIRIPYGTRRQLQPGMMLLLGTHQFTVSSIVDEQSAGGSTAGAGGPGDIADLLARVSSIEISNEDDDGRELRDRIQSLSSRLSEHMANSKRERGSSASAGSAANRKVCILTCFQPEGSPILGKTFVIGPEGGVLGRRSNCAVAINTQIRSATSGEMKVVEIDTAVSSEHAKIEMDAVSSEFYITDGNTKPSTNGVWWRLSGPQQESSFCPLENSTQFIIGKSRFSVKEALSVVDREVENSVGRGDKCSDSK